MTGWFLLCEPLVTAGLLSAHIQANLEDDLVKEALKTVRESDSLGLKVCEAF